MRIEPRSHESVQVVSLGHCVTIRQGVSLACVIGQSRQKESPKSSPYSSVLNQYRFHRSGEYCRIRCSCVESYQSAGGPDAISFVLSVSLVAIFRRRRLQIPVRTQGRLLPRQWTLSLST